MSLTSKSTKLILLDSLLQESIFKINFLGKERKMTRSSPKKNVAPVDSDSDSDSSGFMTHSTFEESMKNKSSNNSARRQNKSTNSSPNKSQGGKKASNRAQGSGRPSTSTPLQGPARKKQTGKSPARKSPAVTPRSRRYRPGTKALMEIRSVQPAAS